MFEITTAMLAPIGAAITDGLGVLVPIGVGIMASMLGLKLIKRVINIFK